MYNNAQIVWNKITWMPIKSRLDKSLFSRNGILDGIEKWTKSSHMHLHGFQKLNFEWKKQVTEEHLLNNSIHITEITCEMKQYIFLETYTYGVKL